MLEKSIAINIKLLKTKFPFVIYWALIISIVKGLGWLFICWMISVSYTHLDVYKRQGKASIVKFLEGLMTFSEIKE